jgi:hypothetical protein
MPVPPDFEEVRDAQRKTELTTEKRKTRNQTMKDFSAQVHISVPRIQTFFFCLVSGVGAIIGVLTQSWIWALICALIAAALVTALGYHKAMNWPLIITLTLIGVAMCNSYSHELSHLSKQPHPISHNMRGILNQAGLSRGHSLHHTSAGKPGFLHGLVSLVETVPSGLYELA